MIERNKKGTKVSPFSICDQMLMSANWGVMPNSLQKKDSKRVSQRPFGYVLYEILDEKLYVLAMHRPGHWEND